MTSPADSRLGRPPYFVGDRVLRRRGSAYVDVRVNAICRRNGLWLFVVRTVDGPGGVGECVTIRSSAPDGRTARLMRARQRRMPR